MSPSTRQVLSHSSLANLLSRMHPGDTHEELTARFDLALERLNELLERPIEVRLEALLEATEQGDARDIGDVLGRDVLAFAMEAGGRLESLSQLLQIRGIGPRTVSALTTALTAEPQPPDYGPEVVPWVPDAPDPGGVPRHERLLHIVQTYVHDESDAEARLEALRALAEAEDDLRSLQYIAAGLWAIRAPEDAIDIARERAGGSAEVGVPRPSWAEVPDGVVRIGSPDDDEWGQPDERPAHEVELAGFDVLAAPVTAALHDVLTRGPARPEDEDLRAPANLSWHDAREVCRTWSSLVEGVVRLPREAEWEKACRAGTTTAWWPGDSPDTVPEVGWVRQEVGPHPVGQLAPNELGLVDVHGNVLEWCEEEYAPYQHPDAKDGRRVVRGGSWADGPEAARSASRDALAPDQVLQTVGFRPVLTDPQAQPPMQAAPPLAPAPLTPTPASGGGGEPEKEPESEPEPEKPIDHVDEPSGPQRPVTGIGTGEDLISMGGGDPMGSTHGSDCCCICCGEAGEHVVPASTSEGHQSPEDRDMTDDVVAGAEDALEEGNAAELGGGENGDKKPGQLGEDEAAVGGAGASADEELSRREKRERARVEEERRKIEEQRGQIEEAEEDLAADRQEAARQQEEVDRLRAEEQALRDQGRDFEADQTRQTREAMEASLREGRGAMEERQQQIDAARDYVDGREAALERAQDRGYGLTDAEHDARTARRNEAQALDRKARVDNLLERLNQREAAQGGLSAEDRALQRNLARESDRLRGRIDGGLSDATAAHARASEAATAAHAATERARATLEQVEARHAAGHASTEDVEAAREALSAAQEAGRAADAAFSAAATERNLARDAYANDSLRGAAEQAHARAMLGGDAADEVRRLRESGRSPEKLNELLGRADNEAALRRLPSDQLREISGEAQRALQALNNVRARVGKPGAVGPNAAHELPPAEAAAARQRLAEARERLDGIQARAHEAAEALGGLRRRRADLQGSLQDARRELARMGETEFSPPSGSAERRERMERLQDQIRAERAEVRGIQAGIEQRRQQLADAQAQVPAARAAAVRAGPLGIAAGAQQRVTDRNAALAPWVRPDGELNAQAVRNAGARQGLNWNRANALQHRIDRLEAAQRAGLAPAGTDEEIRRLQQERNAAFDALAADGWHRTADSAIPDGSTVVGQGMAHAFSEPRITARRERAEARSQRGYASVAATVRRTQAAMGGMFGVGPWSAFGGDLVDRAGSAVREGAGRAADAASQAEDGAERPGTTTVTSFAEEVTLPEHAAALERGLRRLMESMPGSALRDLLDDYRMLYQDGPQDPSEVIARVFDLLEQSATQLEGLDGAARVAAQRAGALRDVVIELEAQLQHGGATTTGAALARARGDYRDAVQDAAARMREQEADAHRRGLEGYANTVGAVAAGYEAQVAQMDGRTTEGTEARVGEILDALDHEIAVARGVAADAATRGEAEAATRERARVAQLAGTRSLALSAVVQGAGSALRQTAAPDPEDRRTWSLVNRALADALGEEAQAVQATVADQGDFEEREEAETRVHQLELARILHLIESGDYASALDELGAIEDGDDEAYLTQLAIHGYSKMMQDRGLRQATGELADEELEDWRNVQDGYLALAEKWASEDATKAQAALVRSQLAQEGGDADKALEHVERAARLAPKDPTILGHQLGLLLSGELDEQRRVKVLNVAARAPKADASAVDEVAFNTMVRGMTDEEADAFGSEIDASALSDKRKSSWHVRLETVLVYRDLDGGAISLAEALDRAQATFARLPDTDLSPETVAAYAHDLTEGLEQLQAHADLRRRFADDPSGLSVSEVRTLARGALERGEVALFRDLIGPLAGAGDSAVVRVAELSHGLRVLEGLDPSSLDAADAAALAEAKAAVGDAAIEVATEGSARARRALATLQAERQAFELEHGDPGLLTQAGHWLAESPNALAVLSPGLWAVGVTDEIHTTHEAQQGAIASHRQALESEERLHLTTLENLAKAAVEIETTLAADPAAAIAAGVQASATRAAEASRLLEENAALVESSDPGRQEQYHNLQAAARAAQLEAQAWQQRARWATVVPTGAARPEEVDRSAEADVESLRRELWGEDGSDDAGLFGRLAVLRTRDQDDPAVQRLVQSVETQIRDTKRTLQRLVFSGPIVDPHTGQLADNPYRSALWAATVEREESRAGEIAARLSEEASEPGASEAIKTRAAFFGELRDNLASARLNDPALVAYRAMHGDAYRTEDGEVDVAHFADSLSVALNRMMDESYREMFAYYFPESRWDRDVIQMVDVMYADALYEYFGTTTDRETSSSLDAVLWRLGDVQDDIVEVQLALSAVTAGREIERDSEHWAVLKRLGILVEEGTGYRLVVPDSLDLSEFRDRLDLPQRTAWNDLLSVGNLTEMTVMFALGGFFSVGLAAVSVRLAGVAGRISAAARAMQTIAESRLAMRALRVVRDAAAFTAAGRAAGGIVGEVSGRPKVERNTTVLEEFSHNLIFFGALEALGPIFRLSRRDPGLERSMKDLQAFLRTGEAAPTLGRAGTGFFRTFFSPAENARFIWSTGAMGVAATGIESVQSGQLPTLEALVRNMLTIPGMHHITGRLGRFVYPRARAAIPPLRAALPARGRPAIPPARAAAAAARFRPAAEHLMREGAAALDQPLSDRRGLATHLAAANVELRVSRRAGTVPHWRRQPSGREQLVITEDATRAQVLDEVTKGESVHRLGIRHNEAFTAEMEARVELDAYRLQVDRYLRDGPDNAHWRSTVGQQLSWRRRLRQIESGARPNLILHEAGDGLLVFGAGQGRTGAFRKRLLDTLRDQLSAPDHGPLADDIAQLNVDQRKTFERRWGFVEARVRERQDAQSRLDDAIDSGDGGEVARQDDRIASAERRMYHHLNIIRNLFQGRGRRGVDRHLELDPNDRTVVDARRDLLEPWAMKRAQHHRIRQALDAVDAALEDAARTGDVEALRPHVETIESLAPEAMGNPGRELARTMRAALDGWATASPSVSATKMAEASARSRSVNHGFMVRTSEKYGEVAVRIALAERFPGAKEIRLIFHGSGSHVLDFVFLVDGRYVVVEAKGGTSRPGSARIGDLRFEQGTPEYIWRTAREMDLAAQELESRDSLTGQEQAQAILYESAANDLYNAMENGTLDSFVATTPYDTTGGGFRPAPTVLQRTRLADGPAPANTTTDRVHPGTGRTRRVNVALVGLPRDHVMEVLSDGGPQMALRTDLDPWVNIADQAARNGATVVAFPGDGLRIVRTDGIGHTDPLADPALRPLHDVADARGVTLVMGVQITSYNRPHTEGVLVIRPGVAKPTLIPRAELGGRPTITVDGVSVGLSLGDGGTAPHGEVHLALGTRDSDSGVARIPDALPAVNRVIRIDPATPVRIDLIRHRWES